ncbi:TetR/AcrR family transcriptional regulator [Rhizobium sp. Leaf306]|uniref:TetR/AcrR family transcriptional regulator n=1 Tax=Rhizobium sp. Leaf306 TaxID=1736330 RepID=UPI000B2E2B87|nr:TetR/AcrR family transcriptional regulator [Rhizobium sp. Leaf306]
MQLFWRRGFVGTSVSDLCTAMGITSPSMYAAFGNKEALYQASLEHFSETRGLPIWLKVMEAKTARETVETLLNCTVNAYTDHNQPLGCMSTLAIVTQDESPKLAELVKAGRESTYQMLSEKFQAAVDSGEFRPDTDVASLARVYLTMLQGISIQARDGAPRDALLAMVTAMMAGWNAITQQGD